MSDADWNDVEWYGPPESSGEYLVTVEYGQRGDDPSDIDIRIEIREWSDPFRMWITDDDKHGYITAWAELPIFYTR